MFEIIRYCNKVFVKVSVKKLTNTDIPYLKYKDEYYIRAEEYFKEFYRIDTFEAYADDSDDCHLHLYIKYAIPVSSLCMLPDTSLIESVKFDKDSVICTKISIPLSI